MRNEVQFHYDREADVLYLSVGKPQKAKTIESSTIRPIRPVYAR